jgi:AraC-like DNA-binding protein
VTPWAYLRDLRLCAARRTLSGFTYDPITSIALSVGYPHFSRFACDYRKRFGELPSETRRNAQSDAGSSSQIQLLRPQRPVLSIASFNTITPSSRIRPF